MRLRRSIVRFALKAKWRSRIQLAKTCSIGTPSRIYISDGGSLTIAERSVLARGTALNAASGGRIEIGRDCYINQNCVIGSQARITIGDMVAIGPNVVLVDTTKDQSARTAGRTRNDRSAAIVIEDFSWIGANAVVLPGVTVHRGGTVGAGAVVTRDVQSGEVVVGVPARAVRRAAT
jgi:carbonic anhydrase/acetyltransferase-like protein (isoleucine patch superfamily)